MRLPCRVLPIHSSRKRDCNDTVKIKAGLSLPFAADCQYFAAIFQRIEASFCRHPRSRRRKMTGTTRQRRRQGSPLQFNVLWNLRYFVDTTEKYHRNHNDLRATQRVAPTIGN